VLTAVIKSRCRARISVRVVSTLTMLVATMLVALLLCPEGYTQGQTAQEVQKSFPDTDPFVTRVAQHQKDLESLLSQYTYTDRITTYTLDKKRQVRSQHADTYYITPTPYEFFTLHVSHDGKPVSQSDLKKQEKEIEHKIRQYEQKAQKPGEVHPKNDILFSDIILKSRFTPLRWDDIHEKRMIVYAFKPKSPPRRQGDLAGKVAGDMEGTMWISPDDAEIARMEFASVSSLSLGLGFLGSVKGFGGFIEQQKVHDEIWLPSHQEFIAQGRQLVTGFRIRQVDEFSDYLKASTDVFQQIHSPSADASGDTKISKQVEQ
jgi:outer membrane lipoprotein-sorting protein